jgi:CubicO group peptidase (beta-lactamase class C family)
MNIRPLPSRIAEFTRSEMARLDVPGVAVGVTHEGALYADGFGVTNVEHPLPVTATTQFQIGSTSKTFTATVAMMLADDGKLDIEAPVRIYLPDFTTSSDAESARVTIRHLLTHHSGWPGDYFKDFGRGDDALAVYVANMARAPQQMRAGEAFSYCNSAFYLLARVIEVIAGAPFETVVMHRLIAPLQMNLTTYFPEDTIPNRVASGHIVTANGAQVARPWQMARCLNGGGGIIATVTDQLTYAQFHLGDGRAADGRQLLTTATLRRMQLPHADAGSMCDRYGLGWMLVDHDGQRLVKHGGATNGFLSSFELYPDLRFGCTVLTNSDTGRELRDTVAAYAREVFLGLSDKHRSELPVEPAALAEFAGEYRALLTISDVTVVDGSLRLTPRQNARLGRVQPLPDAPVRLAFYAPDRTVVMEGSHRGERCEFLRDTSGRIVWLRWDGRLARRQ